MPLFKKILSGDKKFLIMTLVILALGLLFLASASSVSGYRLHLDSYFFVKRQLFWIILGSVVFLMTASKPLASWRGWGGFALLGSFILLIMVFIPGLRAEFGTSRSWVQLGSSFLVFQPSEVVKLSFLIYLAAWLSSRAKLVHDLKQGVIPFFAVLGGIVLLLLLEPDTGSVIIIAATALGVYFLSGAPAKVLVATGAVALLTLLLLMQFSQYRASRILTFLDSSRDPQGAGYHIQQSLIGLGSGGFFGLGLGKSRQKHLFLPRPEDDSIFSVIGEEMGFFVTAGFLVLLGFWLHRMYKIAQQAPPGFERNLVMGIVIWLTLQTFVNIGAMLSLVPLTGVTLPLVSYGGSSMLINLTALGMIYNVSRHYPLAETRGEKRESRR